MQQQTLLRATELGNTGMHITRVGFGAWAIGGGKWQFGWGPQDDEASIETIQWALELGVNWIDTAAAYGLGRSEEVVGRAIAGVVDRPYVFTKASLRARTGAARSVNNLKRDSILREAEREPRAAAASTRSTCTRSTGRGPEEDIEEGWAALRRVEGRRPGASHRRLELRRRTAAADPADRTGRDAAAALLADQS